MIGDFDLSLNALSQSTKLQKNKLPIYVISCHGRVNFILKTNENNNTLEIKTNEYEEDNLLKLSENQYIINSVPLTTDGIVKKNSGDDKILHDLYNSQLSGFDLISNKEIFDIKQCYTTTHVLYDEINHIIGMINSMKNKLSYNFDDYPEISFESKPSMKNYNKCIQAINTIKNWQPFYKSEYHKKFNRLINHLTNISKKLATCYKEHYFKKDKTKQPFYTLPHNTVFNKSLVFYDDDETGAFDMGIFEVSDINKKNIKDKIKKINHERKNKTLREKITRVRNLDRFKPHGMNLRNKTNHIRCIHDNEKNNKISNLLLESVLRKKEVTLSQVTNILGEGIYLCLNCSPLTIYDYTEDKDSFKFITPYKILYKQTKITERTIYKAVLNYLLSLNNYSRLNTRKMCLKQKYVINVALQNHGIIY